MLVTELRELLGARLVAYLGGVKETGLYGSGPRGPAGSPPPRTWPGLRLAYQAALILAERDSPGVLQGWFIGLNPRSATAPPPGGYPRSISTRPGRRSWPPPGGSAAVG